MDIVAKFHLKDEFCSMVKGFANSYSIAEAKCAKPGRSLSLRSLATALLPKEEGEEPVNLADRAKTAYTLMAKVFETEQAESGAGNLTFLFSVDLENLIFLFELHKSLPCEPCFINSFP